MSFFTAKTTRALIYWLPIHLVSKGKGKSSRHSASLTSHQRHPDMLACWFYRFGVQKDVECSFGILQSKFQIIDRSSRLWFLPEMADVIHCCVILYNMIIVNRVQALGLEVGTLEQRDNDYVTKLSDSGELWVRWFKRSDQFETQTPILCCEKSWLSICGARKGYQWLYLANKCRVPVYYVFSSDCIFFCINCNFEIWSILEITGSVPGIENSAILLWCSRMVFFSEQQQTILP